MSSINTLASSLKHGKSKSKLSGNLQNLGKKNQVLDTSFQKVELAFVCLSLIKLF